MQPEQGEEEPAQEEAQEESIEPERDEEAGEEETEGEEGFEPQETEDEADSESSSEEGLEEGIEDIGRIKKSRKKRGILLRARARPKGTLADKVTKTAAVLGGLGIAAWVIKGIIEARIKKGGE